MGRSLSSVLIALAAAAVGGTALAYPTPVDFDGSLMRWDINAGTQITYGIDADNPQDATVYEGAVDSAAALWNGVPTSYFRYTAAGAGTKPQVTIHLQSALSGVRESAGYALFDEYNGKLPVHCAIYVQVDDTIAYDDMAKTFLHELGHCLGLGHSLIPQAIMSYSLDQNRFGLDVDDEAAASRLYPADGSKPSLPPGCAAGHSLRGSTWLTFFVLIAPLLRVLPGLLRRRFDSI